MRILLSIIVVLSIGSQGVLFFKLQDIIYSAKIVTSRINALNSVIKEQEEKLKALISKIKAPKVKIPKIKVPAIKPPPVPRVFF